VKSHAVIQQNEIVNMVVTKSMSFSSGVLFRTAIQAYERLATAEDDNTPAQNDAVVSILFSAATLEAYINELTELASISNSPKLNDEIIKQFLNVVSELEKSNESTRLKILFAKYIFTNQSYDKGRHPYQDLDLLFRLRNSIIHLKPSDDIAEPDKIIKSLESKKLLGIYKKGVIAGRLSKISTRAVARWAINTVIIIVEDIKQGIINSSINSSGVKTLLISNFCGFEKVV
jgi:hypothetical protein